MLDHEPNFSLKIPPDAGPTLLRFVRQLGLTHVYTWISEEQRNREYLSRLAERIHAAGLTLYNVGNMDVAKSPAIHLGLPDRDRRIDQFQTFLEDLSAVGVRYTTFTWEPDQVWSTGRTHVRESSARTVDQAKLGAQPNTHAREYSRDELWENFEYFIERMIPAAESTSVSLALHPNDPPMESIAGIPCLIRSGDDYRRAFEIAGSAHLGMEFCTGCWLEGGPAFGNITAALEEFTHAGRVFIVHFRNVSAPLPQFTETFLDNGYHDMYELMRILHQADYHGSISLDHTPRFFEDPDYPYAESAYAIAYMRALSERARAESNQR